MRPSILIAISLLAACTSADILRVDPAPRPAQAQAVPVLLDEPSSSYRSIALIEVSGGFGASLQRMSQRLAKEAAKLGGDAVIITRQSGESGSALIPVGSSFVTVPTDDSRLVGKVIVYSQSTQTDPGSARDLHQ